MIVLKIDETFAWLKNFWIWRRSMSSLYLKKTLLNRIPGDFSWSHHCNLMLKTMAAGCMLSNDVEFPKNRTVDGRRNSPTPLSFRLPAPMLEMPNWESETHTQVQKWWFQMQITARKKRSSWRIVGRMWRDVPTWAKTDRSGRRGCRRFIGIMMQRIDTARRTRGSDQTNHRPLSSRHLMSLHPSISPIPHCLFSSVLHVPTILSICWLSISSECYTSPQCHSSGYSLSSETTHDFRKKNF